MARVVMVVQVMMALIVVLGMVDLGAAVGGSKAEVNGSGMMTKRRVLADDTTTYISYDALTADSVPCDTSGASYYDCTTDTANAYTTSCTTITTCDHLTT